MSTPLPRRPAAARPAPTRRPWGRLLLVAGAVALPLLEIWLLIQLSQLVGGWITLLVVGLGMVLGVLLTRREGSRAWRSLTAGVREGRPVSDEIASGGLVLLGGAALIVPGLVTDVVGLFLLLPPTRRLAVRALERWSRARMRRMGVDVDVLRARMDRAGTVEGEVVEPAPGPRADPTLIRGEIEE